MALSSIDVAPDVVGQALPGTVRPVAVETISGVDYQKFIQVDSNGNNLAAGLVPEVYDYIALGYTGDNLTSVTYKTGGSSGTTVATLTLAYTGTQLDSITKA